MKEKKGITLVALIITIVVMLILVATTLTITLGQNGIISKAKEAKESTQRATEQEELANIVWGAINDNGTFTADSVKTILERQGATVEGTAFPLKVTYKGEKFIVDDKGQVTKDNPGIGEQGQLEDIPGDSDITCNAGGAWQVENNDGVYTITGYTGNETAVTIPNVYVDEQNASHDITAIGMAALAGIDYGAYLSAGNPQDPGEAAEGVLDQYIAPMNNVISVTIPEGITTIGGAAFAFTQSLNTVIIEANITTAPAREDESGPIFIGSQVKNIEFSDGVTTIPQAICYEMSGLTSISIPNSVTTIGDHAFSGVQCFSTTFTLPTSIQTLEDRCFQDTNITSLIIPNEASALTVNDVSFSGEHINNIKVYGKNLTDATTLVNAMVYNGSYNATDNETYIEFTKNI